MKINSLSDIQNYLLNKNICIIGSANTILNNKKDIDNTFDIICRMNEAFPINKDYSDFIGTRTDVLFSGCEVNVESINPEIMISHFQIASIYKIENNLIHKRDNVHFMNLNDWADLRHDLQNYQPTTGTLGIYWLNKYINFKKLTIFGFNFYETAPWHNRKITNVHNFKLEKLYVTNLIKNNRKIELILE